LNKKNINKKKMKFGSRLDSGISPRKIAGIKIVDNNLNKRVSDIFNARDEIVFDNKNHYFENKQKTAQVVEQRMENKLRVLYQILFY
jgi:hypothetical protein